MTKLENLLVILMEECSEIQKEAAKSLRFGLDSDNNGKLEFKNKELLLYEFNDLVAVMYLLKEGGYIDYIFDKDLHDKKKEKIRKYLKYSEESGTVI